MARFEGPQNEKTFSDKPPHPLDSLLPIYRAWRNKGKSTVHLSNDYSQGIEDFAQLVEPRQDTERLEVDYDKHGNPQFKDGYTLRLVSCFRIFLSLSEDDRDFVVSNIRRGVMWRGDDVEFFRSVVSEHFKYKADPQAYIQENASRIARAAKGMVI